MPEHGLCGDDDDDAEPRREHVNPRHSYTWVSLPSAPATLQGQSQWVPFGAVALLVRASSISQAWTTGPFAPANRQTRPSHASAVAGRAGQQRAMSTHRNDVYNSQQASWTQVPAQVRSGHRHPKLGIVLHARPSKREDLEGGRGQRAMSSRGKPAVQHLQRPCCFPRLTDAPKKRGEQGGTA